MVTVMSQTLVPEEESVRLAHTDTLPGHMVGPLLTLL